MYITDDLILSYHIERVHSGNTICLICEKGFSKDLNAHSHVDKIHKDFTKKVQTRSFIQVDIEAIRIYGTGI